MNIALSSRLVMLALLLFVPFAQANLPEFTQLVKQNGPAVVNISTTAKRLDSRDLSSEFSFPDLPEDSPFRDFFERFFREGPGIPGDSSPSRSLGSGFIISSDGYILTNTHVVKDADKIIVKLNDQSEREAKLVGSDRRTDVALLKVEGSGLPTVKLGDSDKVEVGEWVIAIGSPFGLDWTATQGIVSALSRSLPSDAYVPFIQTDVAVNPGNSGGPLFNTDGQVIGVNSQIYSRTGGYMGLSFAIPINIAMQVADQIKRNGHASHGWLGVLIQPVTPELAESFGLDRARGALVSKVMPGSPAEKAGIKTGDVIVSFDGKTVERSSDLPLRVGSTAAGTRVEVGLIRDGRTKDAKVMIEALSSAQEDELYGDSRVAPPRAAPASTAVMGMTLDDLPPVERQRRDIKEGGVLVTSVTGEPALGAGIHRGDVILKLNNVSVGGAEELKKRLMDLPQGKPAPVLIQRGDAPLFLALKPASKKDK